MSVAFVGMFAFSFTRDGELDRQAFRWFSYFSFGRYLAGKHIFYYSGCSDEVVLQGNLLLTYFSGLIPGIIADLFGISRNINDANYEISEYIFGRWTQGGLSPYRKVSTLWVFLNNFDIYCFRILSNFLSKQV